DVADLSFLELMRTDKAGSGRSYSKSTRRYSTSTGRWLSTNYPAPTVPLSTPTPREKAQHVTQTLESIFFAIYTNGLTILKLRLYSGSTAWPALESPPFPALSPAPSPLAATSVPASSSREAMATVAKWISFSQQSPAK